jgi:hypothetical protein
MIEVECPCVTEKVLHVFEQERDARKFRVSSWLAT